MTKNKMPDEIWAGLDTYMNSFRMWKPIDYIPVSERYAGEPYIKKSIYDKTKKAGLEYYRLLENAEMKIDRLKEDYKMVCEDSIPVEKIEALLELTHEHGFGEASLIAQLQDLVNKAVEK
jgi:hypothetical protein